MARSSFVGVDLEIELRTSILLRVLFEEVLLHFLVVFVWNSAQLVHIFLSISSVEVFWEGLPNVSEYLVSVSSCDRLIKHIDWERQAVYSCRDQISLIIQLNFNHLLVRSLVDLTMLVNALFMVHSMPQRDSDSDDGSFIGILFLNNSLALSFSSVFVKHAPKSWNLSLDDSLGNRYKSDLADYGLQLGIVKVHFLGQLLRKDI